MPSRGSNKLPMITEGSEQSKTSDARLRISRSFDIFNSKFRYEIEYEHWVTSKIGSGSVTYQSAGRNVRIRATTSTGDRAILQTRRYFTTHTSKPYRLRGSLLFGAGKANVYQRFGLFDNNDGMFFEYAGTTLKVVTRAGGSDTAFAQSDWNMDHLDGTGPSGKILDLTKSQLLGIEHLGQGLSKVRFSINIDGEIIYVHEDSNSNETTSPISSTFDLPIRAEIQNIGAAASTTDLTFGSCDYSTEVESIGNETTHSVHRGQLGVSVTTKRPVLSIKPRLSFQGKTMRKTVKPESLSILSISNPIFYELIIVHTGHGTLSSASFTAAHGDSICMYDIAATGVHGGHVIDSGFVPSGSGPKEYGHIGTDAALAYLSVNACGTTSDIFVINCSGIGGGATVRASITFYDGE